MKTAKEEGFELLNHLGIAPGVQRRFSSTVSQKPSGKLNFIHKNEVDEMVDQEHFTLRGFKQASRGMAICCDSNKEAVADLYVSDSVMNLVAFCHIHYGRLSFRHSAFFSTGVKPEKGLFLHYWGKYNKGKIHLLFGNSLLGRILDCKLAHWVRGEDFSFYLDRSQIITSNSLDRSYTIPREGFSMRRYFRRIGGRNLVTTHKPSLKSIDNYINLLFNQTL